MTKTVRISVGILVSIIVLLVVVVLGLQIFLKHGLNTAIQKKAIPTAEEILGVNVDIGNASVSLLGGSVAISGVKLGNPEGFVEPEIFSVNSFNVDLGVMAIFKGIIKVTDLDVENLRLTISRNRAGAINANEFRKLLQSDETEKETKEERTEKETIKEAEAKETQLPNILIRELNIDIAAAYVDHKISMDPLRLGFNTSISMKNVATFGGPDSEWGTFELKASLENNPNAFVTDIKGRIAPLVDPAKLSFDIDGKVESINLTSMDKLVEETGIKSESVTLGITIKCRDSVYDKKTSAITIRFKNPQLVGKLAKKVKGVPLPPDLTISVPLGGTINEPDYQWSKALLRTVLDNAAKGFGSALKAFSPKEKKDSRGLFKKLGDSFKPN